MTNDIDQEIRLRVQGFAEDIAVLIQQAVAQAVTEALASAALPVSSFGAKRTTSSASKASPGPRKTAAKPGPKKGAGKKNAGGSLAAKKIKKRSPAQLDRLTDRLAKEISRKSGRGIEEIGRALNVETVDLKLPIIKLIDNKTIKKVGEKRSTKYFAR